MEANACRSAVCSALVRQLGVTAKVVELIQNENEHDLDEEYEQLEAQLRQQQAILRMFTLRLQSQSSRTPRSVWMRVRSKDWWERVVLKEFTDTEWMETFRMTRRSFDKLCGLMEGVLSPQSVTVRAPIPLQMRVAIVLYKLACCAEYGIVAKQFGVHKSTVFKFVHSFCTGMVSTVMSSLIRVPTLNEARDIAARFKKKFMIPQIIGCIDGTHIPVLPPSDGRRDFINSKGWPSYVLQAVVDDMYRFWDISCKMPGSSYDANILSESSLYKSRSLLPKDPKEICGTSVDFFLLGDSTYPLTDWLMKGYTQAPPITLQEESFNAYLSSAQTTVKIAIGRLKSRWRVLAKRSDFHYSFSPKVIATCCALHNFCEMEKETVSPAWTEQRAELERSLMQPGHPPCDTATPEGEEVRAALTHYLSDHFPLR